MQEEHSPKVKGRGMNNSNPGWIKKVNIFMPLEENPEVNEWRNDLTWSGCSIHCLCHHPDWKGMWHCSRSPPRFLHLFPDACPSLPSFVMAQTHIPLVGIHQLKKFTFSSVLPKTTLALSQGPYFLSRSADGHWCVCVLPMCALKGPGLKAAPCIGC